MKRRLFAALAAAVMLCSVPVGAAADVSYLPGDVNMDGKVDAEDAQLILMDYTEKIAHLDGFLTEEQRMIGNIDGEVRIFETGIGSYKKRIELVADARDAVNTLQYYTARLVNPTITMEDVLGCEPAVFEAIDEFFKTHTLVQDAKTGRFSYAEKAERASDGINSEKGISVKSRYTLFVHTRPALI